MQTFLGGRLHLLDPKPHEIDPRDIARGLAFQCRYTGQCSHFYSVAQHSVLCAEMAEKDGADLNTAQVMLLHDATEAYIGDMNRPLKSALPEYQDIEHKLWLAIALRFCLLPDMPAAVKDIDKRMLAIEKAALCPNAEEWPGVPEVKVESFFAWEPNYALMKFGAKFHELFPDDTVFRKTH
jgi:5'-deoxynucleotidase YfbR-like HD superfamily hydrolase